MNNFYPENSELPTPPSSAILNDFITYEYNTKGIHLRKTCLETGNILEIDYDGSEENSLNFESSTAYIETYFNIGDPFKLNSIRPINHIFY